MAKSLITIHDRIKLDLSTMDKKHGGARHSDPYEWILGIDEVGWGCIAGELLLCGVAIHRDLLNNWPDDPILKTIRDSKKLSSKARHDIKKAVEERNWEDKLRFFYGRCDVAHINKYGLASAYDECLRQILHNLPIFIRRYLVFLDGKRVPKGLLPYPTSLQIKGDDSSLAIGLASILAKETRDEAMTELHNQYPHYNWINNKGYGTADHIQGLKDHGISPHHRSKGTATILND